MTLQKFLKEKLLFLTTQILIVVFITVLMKVMSINAYAVFFTVLGIVLFDSASLSVEYVKKCSFYKYLNDSISNLDKKHLISELLEDPSFLEGEILCDVLRQTTKSMNDEIAKYRISAEEYKEYVETWIHEIKTPISCIGLICENNKNEITKSIFEETGKINKFVEQTLFYARSTAVEKDYSVRQIQLDALIKSIVKNHSRQMIESKVEIRLNSLNAIVISDPKWLDFIIGQIVSNSIKYRGKSPVIFFEAVENDTQIILSIKDNGIGIPECDLSRVFDKGFTGENGRKYAKSTGIGLYLCKRLCDKMNLGLMLTSKINKGTIINIIFPKDKAIFFE